MGWGGTVDLERLKTADFQWYTGNANSVNEFPPQDTAYSSQAEYYFDKYPH